MTTNESQLVELGGRKVNISKYTEDRTEAFYFWHGDQTDEGVEVKTGGTHVVTERTVTLPPQFDRRYDNLRTCVYFIYYKVDIFKIDVDGVEVHKETGDRYDFATYIYDYQTEHMDGLDVSDGFKQFLKGVIARRDEPCFVSGRAPSHPIWSDPATTHLAEADSITQ